MLPAHGLARAYADDWLDRRAITPNLYAEIEGHEAILALVALGCGVGVVPQLVLEKRFDCITKLAVGLSVITPKLRETGRQLLARYRFLEGSDRA